MSGHSKWSSIKHKKAAVDAKRGKLFTKLIKEITVAAKFGGGDFSTNARLRTAIGAARAGNMPSDNIERAIKKGTSELPGVVYEEITYEGYGPGGVAIMIETMTDNKRRTVAEIRYIFSKIGGNLGESGCVSWMFTKTGLILIPVEGTDEEEIMETTLELGASDFDMDESFYEIYTDMGSLFDIREILISKGYDVKSAEITATPQSTIIVNEQEAKKLIKLLSALEDHDDVQKLYTNMEIPDEIMAGLE